MSEQASETLEQLQRENERLRNILYATTSLRDWLQADYTIEEYNAFVDEYERLKAEENDDVQ